MEQLLETTNLRLRSLESSDTTLMYEMENDTTMWDVSTTVQPFSRKAIMQYIQNTESNIYKEQQLRLVIQLKHPDGTDDKAIGFIDLTDFCPRNLRAEVGIAILTDYQHKGYATEAMQLLQHYASNFLFIHQLFAYVANDNKPAQKLFEKNGFTKTGQLLDWIKTKNQYHPVTIFQKIL